MRGEEDNQVEMFSYIPLESRIPESHPLRGMREMVDEVLKQMSGTFDTIYCEGGRPSIPPEYLLRALLLQVLFTIRSEYQLLENIRYNLLYRWFVGLGQDDRVWDETMFSKNRVRLLEGKVAQEFFEKVVGMAKEFDLLSDQHFTVDGTLIQAWASHKSFVPRGSEKPKGGKRNNDVDFRGKKRSNKTHQSSTDPDSRMFRKGFHTPANLCMMGHVLMENRNGLAVGGMVTHAATEKEWDAALELVERQFKGKKRRTLGADRGYDLARFVDKLREKNITPHIAKKKSCGGQIDGRTLRHPGYKISLIFRKRVEEIFGWLKSIGPMRQTHFRGIPKVDWVFHLGLATYNLLRMRNIILTTPP